jgi:uncharacterized protein (TIGR02246 family)
MVAPEDVRKVVDAYVDGYRREDKAAVLELFRPDAVWHDPVGQPPHVGHEGIGAFWDQAHAMADRIELQPRDIVVCGNEAAMIFEIHATIADSTMIIEAVETFEIDDDGRIALLKAYWDMSRARTRA